jgi:hypothetical protein
MSAKANQSGGAKLGYIGWGEPESAIPVAGGHIDDYINRWDRSPQADVLPAVKFQAFWLHEVRD